MKPTEANKISALINSIIVWGGMAEKAVQVDPVDIKKFELAVSRYNKAADELIDMGIAVYKFSYPYLEQDNAKINA